MDEGYYLDQCDRYFNSLDTFANHAKKPNYAADVIRWEWPPWLKLTGHGARSMRIDALVRLYPTKVINRHYELTQDKPQARCNVSFKYFGRVKLVDIYEEFTFNQAGEITFIEAWSNSNHVTTTGRLSTNPDISDLDKRRSHPVYYWIKELARWF